MRPLSEDLRCRIIEAKEFGEGTGEVSERFKVNRKSVARLWKQYTVSGSAPSPPVSPSLHPTIATASFAMPAMRLFK